MNFDIDETAALMDITHRPPLLFVEGSGMWLTDHRGKRYLDFIQGWAVNALGHCPPQIAAALAHQSSQFINASPAFYNAPAIALAKRLATLSGLERTFFASSGAEANEGAIKLARKWGQLNRGGAHEIVCFENSFHGRTLATMSASCKAGWDLLFEPKVPGFVTARFNDAGSVEAAIGPRTVAIWIEPVQGEAGVLPSDHEFLRALRALADRHGLLLMFDEVQTGIGRTGTMFAFEQAGVRPDVLTLGKGIGGGVPLAALLARDAVSCFEPGDQGGTYCGNPLMTAVGEAVVAAVAAPGFLEAVRRRSKHLVARLEALARAHQFVEVRGRGLLLAVELAAPIAASIVEAARSLEPLGLLVNAPRPNVLRFMPALNVSDDEIDCMIDLLTESIRSAS